MEDRLLLIHSLCHIESYAIDLSWDMCVRFVGGGGMGLRQQHEEEGGEGKPVHQSEKHHRQMHAGIGLPWEFFDDWSRVNNPI